MRPHETASGPGTYLRRANELASSWPVLYTVTFALALLCGVIRTAVAYPILWVALKLLGEPASRVNDLTLLVGYGPLVLSLATLIFPVGGLWWKLRLGVRAPSRSERLVFERAISTLTAASPALSRPRRWFVLESHELTAWVYADTLMLTRGLIASGLLEGVLAHELAHLNSSDARLAAALHRLTTPPRGEMRRGLRTISLFATGGFALSVTRAQWDAYWRGREQRADRFAADLGQGAALARFYAADGFASDLAAPLVGTAGDGGNY